jgi:hypothetical protein
MSQVAPVALTDPRLGIGRGGMVGPGDANASVTDAARRDAVKGRIVTVGLGDGPDGVDAIRSEAHNCPSGCSEWGRIGLESSQVEDNHHCKSLTQKASAFGMAALNLLVEGSTPSRPTKSASCESRRRSLSLCDAMSGTLTSRPSVDAPSCNAAASAPCAPARRPCRSRPSVAAAGTGTPRRSDRAHSAGPTSTRAARAC